MKQSLVEFYRQQVFPRLKIELVYAGVRFQSRGSANWRGPCPLHGGNNPQAFAVNPRTLRWHCFTGCGRGGDVLAFLNGGESPRGRQFIQIVERVAELVGLGLPETGIGRLPVAAPPAPETPTPSGSEFGDCESALCQFQKALPGSLGESYLTSRGVSLSQAQRWGVGYAPAGKWPHQARDWKLGRLVFPHTDPDGRVLNLYGRAIGTAENVPVTLRHAHLPGVRGYFGASHLVDGEGPLWVCEGVFDALSLAMAGCARVVATFGVSGWRWEWARKVEHLVFAYDGDRAGQETLRKMAVEGKIRGKAVGMLDPGVLGSHKDLNEAWCAGALRPNL